MTHTSADVNYSRVIFSGSMTSLAAACYEGHVAVVKRLLINVTLQCEVNAVSGVMRNTALHEVIRYTRETPLHVSCYRGDTAAVVDVVYESDVNMQDKGGRTAMHNACVNGHLDIVKVLLSVFADTDITNDYGDTPVALCEYYGSPELAHYIQHNHLMYVSGDGDVNNAGVVDRTNHNTSITRRPTRHVNKKRKYADTHHVIQNKIRATAVKSNSNNM
jgi:ankyrin repeat protein